MKLWLGVDVGINGGIAFIPERGNSWAIKMPDTLCDLWDAIDNIGFDFTYLHACLERVHSSPQMGVKSAFTFGQGFGHLEMALTAAKIPFTYVTPQKWQKELGCLTGGNKSITKARAQQLFPHIKCTHAISDALLIAEYCRRTIR